MVRHIAGAESAWGGLAGRSPPLRVRSRAAALMALCLPLLAGCGTDLKGLAAENGALFWEAEEAVAAAGTRPQGPELTAPVYRAESAKEEACQFLTDGQSERMQEKDPTVPSLWDGFVSDLGQLVALLVPIPMVERCAAAQAAYRQSLDDLRQRLEVEETALR